MVVVAYYTIGAEIDYRVFLKRFRKSLEKFKLAHEIEKIKDRGSWRKNLAYRPQFFLKMLKKHKQPILSIDVDAEVCARPSLLMDEPGCDVAFHCFFDKKPCGGTLYFANTRGAKTMLREWARLEKKYPNSRSDEWNLRRIFCMPDCKGLHISRLYLPASYLRVPSYKKIGIDAIIDHAMISCTAKVKPKKPPEPVMKW